MSQLNQSLRVHAGPFTALFDPQLAFLRHVRLGKTEVIRGIYAAIRDQDWNSIPFVINDFRLKSSPQDFVISFLAKCSQGKINFDWRGEITGTKEGIIRYRFNGQSKSSFFKNRIGLCVLHPIKECAGLRCSVEHTDGSVTQGRFPNQISPHQPFQDIKSITHPVTSDLKATVTFEGEVFEMEDQRNWTDASFKTYSTPLTLPYPVEISTGSHFEHLVTLGLHHSKSQSIADFITDEAVTGTADNSVVVCAMWSQSRVIPPIGFSMVTFSIATENTLPSSDVVQKLKAISPSHLRVDLHLFTDLWKKELQCALELAIQIGAKLEIAVHSCDATNAASESDLRQCLEKLENHRDRITRWLVFAADVQTTSPPLSAAIQQMLADFDATIPIVIGTDAYFAELNRQRPSVEPGNAVCYSINPQVHAFDNLSLCETLGAQRATVDSAQAIFAGPVVISPITLRPRSNPNATLLSAGQNLPEPETDERQVTGFAAAWTVGVLAQLATHQGVESLTLYEAFGPRGLMNSSGDVYPVYDVFKNLHRYEAICETVCSHPLQVTALGLLQADGKRGFLLGNLSDKPQQITVEFGSHPTIHVEVGSASVLHLTPEALS